MGSSEYSIIKTLGYSSLFDFPLTRDEIYYYLHSEKTLSKEDVDHLLNTSRHIVSSHGLYTLQGHEATIRRRLELASCNSEKLEQAKKIARWLSLIPTIYFIGVSGSVAVGNGNEEDDIDLFIITKENTLFTTRVIALCFLELLGKRRKRDAGDAPNMICLNMWMDRGTLAFDEKRQNLYTAREIHQLYPLVDKSGTYKKFIQANRWTTRFLSHAHGKKPLKSLRTNQRWESIARVFEPLARKFQIRFMQGHVTTEEVTSFLLAFHPRDHSPAVLMKYKKLLDTYKNTINK